MKNSYAAWCAGFLAMATVHLNAQDTYHQELINLLASDHGIENPTFVFSNSEQSNTDGMYLYGNSSLQIASTQDFTFSIIQNYSINAAGSNAWDSGAGHRNVQSVAKDDVIVVSFWARKTSDESEVTFFAEDGVTFDKELDFKMSFTTDWAQYFGAFKARKDYVIAGLTVGFHLATRVHSFQLAGFTALNYGNIELTKAPSTFAPQFYGGYEEDAAWRTTAATRIEELRKEDLVVRVVDGLGNPIANAEVAIEMQQHDFGFGSALVGCRFPGNRCTDETYLDKILNLDGKGHGFNVAVTENALKWTGWESEWIGTPSETVSAIRWLTDRNISVRGHTLVWPGWSHVPADLESMQTDLTYLRSRINERLETMLNDPDLRSMITEWDVLNEITQVRDLEAAFSRDPNFSSGREIYQEILNKAKELQPELKSYINDYVVLSGGGAGSGVINRYKSYLDEIVDAGIDIDGIGFQCHIGSQPTSIPKIKEVLDEFSDVYQTRIKITEYDINPSVDEETQGVYLSDFLTMIFSHPAVDAFLMWGFWDGNHWKSNAPMFNLDWSLKPSGQAFIDKVFNEWWTNENGTTDDTGHMALRVFKGKHKVTVTVNGITHDQTITSSKTDTVVIGFESTSTDQLNGRRSYHLFPNPTSTFIKINGEDVDPRVDLQVTTLGGILVQSKKNVSISDKVPIELPIGIYFLKIEGSRGSEIHKLVIH